MLEKIIELGKYAQENGRGDVACVLFTLAGAISMGSLPELSKLCYDFADKKLEEIHKLQSAKYN